MSSGHEVFGVGLISGPALNGFEFEVRCGRKSKVNKRFTQASWQKIWPRLKIAVQTYSHLLIFGGLRERSPIFHLPLPPLRSEKSRALDISPLYCTPSPLILTLELAGATTKNKFLDIRA